MAEFQHVLDSFVEGLRKDLDADQTAGMSPAELEAHDTERRLAASYDMAAAYLQARLQVGAATEAEQAQYLRAMKHHHDHVSDLVESPIERAILPWLVSADLPSLRTKVIRTARPGEDTYPRKHDLVVVPQFPIGRHRLDFALVLTANDRRLILAFECDGRAFHRDPDDHARDRYLRAFGVATVRASGREIFSNPQGCMERIDEAFASWLAGTMRFAS